jgi:hypothetical protein
MPYWAIIHRRQRRFERGATLAIQRLLVDPWMYATHERRNLSQAQESMIPGGTHSSLATMVREDYHENATAIHSGAAGKVRK